MSPFGHAPGNRWDGLNLGTGIGRERTGAAARLARQRFSVRDPPGRPLLTLLGRPILRRESASDKAGRLESF